MSVGGTTFALYKPLTTPSAITHACSGSFLDGGSRDLLVVKENFLEVYALDQEAFDKQTTIAAAYQQGGRTGQTLLQRRFDARLFGNVEGLTTVRLPGWTRDAVLLAYPHSKLALCAWDAGVQEVVTLAIWSQDEEVIEKQRMSEAAQAAAAAGAGSTAAVAAAAAGKSKLLGSSLLTQVKKFIPPMLRLDPNNRCAALASFDAFLSIWDLTAQAQPAPLNAAQTANGGEAAAAGRGTDETTIPVKTGLTTSATGATSFYAHSSPSALFSSLDGVGFIPSLASPSVYSLMALGLGTITDMQFLHGFEDPTLLILHEKRRTWEGRYAAAKATQVLSCVTFHLRAQSFSLIGSMANISHDASSVHAIPQPIGGALIFQQNLLLHWNNNALDYALACNELGQEQARTEKWNAGQTAHVCKLDRAKLVFLSTHTDRVLGLLATADGVSYLFTMVPSGSQVRQMTLDPIGYLPQPTGLVRIGNPSTARMLLSSQPSTSAMNVQAERKTNFVFVYGRRGPAVVLEYRRPEDGPGKDDRLHWISSHDSDTQAEFAEAQARQEREREEQRRKGEEREQRERKVKQEQQQQAQPMETDEKKGLEAQLDAAATPSSPSAPATGASSSAAGAKTSIDEPAPKRSKLDEMYSTLTGGSTLETDDLLDLFGFGKVGETDALEEKQQREREEEKMKDDTGKVVGQLEDTTAADRIVAKAALDQEAARVERLQRAMRGQRDVLPPLLFFVRDRLGCLSPASDLTLGYALPRGAASADRDSLELAQSLEDESAMRRENNNAAAAAGEAEGKEMTDAEERERDEREKREMIELERRWRNKDRASRVLEYIQLAGHAESGAVAMSTEGVMPEVVTESPLQRKVVGCWTVKQTTKPAGKKRRSLAADHAETYDSLLLLSTPSTTLVIQTGTELAELEEHPFARERTIFAGNVHAKVGGAESEGEEVEAIVQVTRSSLLLIHNGALVQTRSLPNEGLTVAAVIAGPFVHVRLESGGAYLFRVAAFSHPKQGAVLELQQCSSYIAGNYGAMTAAWLFKDTSKERAMRKLKRGGSSAGANGIVAADGTSAMELDQASLTRPNTTSAAAPGGDPLDDLERLLGGEDDTLMTPAPEAHAAASKLTSKESSVMAPDYYLIVACGPTISVRLLLDVFGRHDDTLVAMFYSVPLGQRILTSDASPSTLPLPVNDLPIITDLCLTTLGSSSLPVLCVMLSNGDLLTYQAFFASAASQQLQFLKVSTGAPLTRPFLSQFARAYENAAEKVYRDAYGAKVRLGKVQQSRFHVFSNLSGQSSLLLSGTKPLLLTSTRGTLRCHPFCLSMRPREDNPATRDGGRALEEDEEEDAVEGGGEEEEEVEELLPEGQRKQGLLAAAPFHNPNCPYGMIYFDSHGTLHMATVPPPMRVPTHPLWMSQRKREQMGLVSPLAASLNTPSYLATAVGGLNPLECDYDAPLLTRMMHLGATPLFIVRHIPTSTTAVVLLHRPRIPSLELESDRSLPQYGRKYEVILFSRDWEIVARYAEFEPHEMVCDCIAVRMNRKMYIALGTSENRGEDHAARGRIILLDLFHGVGNSNEIDPATGQAQQVKVFKMKIYTQAEKLPVSKLAQLGHNVLVTAQGSKIICYRHNGKQLHGCAFFDAQLFITSVTCLNQFILYGDVARGMHLLYYDPILKTLSQLGQTAEAFHVTACDFLVDQRALNLVCADWQGNLQIFRFSPNTPSAASNKMQLASYENPHVSHTNSTQTLRESAFTSTSLLGGLGYKLNLKNDFHLGERTSKMIKMKVRTRGGAGGAATAAGAAQSAAQVSLSLDGRSPNKLSRPFSQPGGAGAPVSTVQSYLLLTSFSGAHAQLMPMDHLVFRRLNTLVVTMSTQRRQIGGLNPLAYRSVNGRKMLRNYVERQSMQMLILFSRLSSLVLPRSALSQTLPHLRSLPSSLRQEGPRRFPPLPVPCAGHGGTVEPGQADWNHPSADRGESQGDCVGHAGILGRRARTTDSCSWMRTLRVRGARAIPCASSSRNEVKHCSHAIWKSNSHLYVHEIELRACEALDLASTARSLSPILSLAMGSSNPPVSAGSASAFAIGCGESWSRPNAEKKEPRLARRRRQGSAILVLSTSLDQSPRDPEQRRPAR
jgi:hypothetical protein